MPRQRRIVDGQIPGGPALAHHPFGQAPTRVRRERHAVAAVPERVIHRQRGVRLGHARHHVVADVHPAPPGIGHVHAPLRRELARQAFAQQRQMPGMLRIGAAQGATAADLHAAVRQQAVVEAQGARSGDEHGAFQARGLAFGG
ncbi:hypothetical protein G6F68_018564 [Rhizopus microsporus]|nr:hypothetical protein G6F68_018564 [Rhizopus microsporus]